MTESIDMSKVTLGELVKTCEVSQCLTCKFYGFCGTNKLNDRLHVDNIVLPCDWDLEIPVNKNVGKDDEFYRFGSYNDWPEV